MGALGQLERNRGELEELRAVLDTCESFFHGQQLELPQREFCFAPIDAHTRG